MIFGRRDKSLFLSWSKAKRTNEEILKLIQIASRTRPSCLHFFVVAIFNVARVAFLVRQRSVLKNKLTELTAE